MTKFTALKSFPLSSDGVNKEDIEKGQTISVPSNLIYGLTRDGYIEPFVKGAKKAKKKSAKRTKKKDAGAAPENKMLDPAKENKSGPEDAIKAARAEYQEVFGKRAYAGWASDVLLKKIAEHKAGGEA